MANDATAYAKFIAPMRFEVTTGSGHTVTIDAKPESGGENAGPQPMELLLVALSGCTGMDVASILRKKRQDVTGYEIHVHGVRAETHPMVFVEVEVEHVVTGHNVDPQAVKRAIELSDTQYCGVGNTLNKTAKLTHTFRIVEAE